MDSLYPESGLCWSSGLFEVVGKRGSFAEMLGVKLCYLREEWHVCLQCRGEAGYRFRCCLAVVESMGHVDGLSPLNT